MTTRTRFAVTFPRGRCGLEILFDQAAAQFIVGVCHSEVAKIYKSVIQNAQIVSINWKVTKNLNSMEAIQELFKEYEPISKRVVFQARFTADQLEVVEKFHKDEQEFEILDFNTEEDMKVGQYMVKLRTRPLGFTVASSPSGEVEVVQVDSVHEEDIKLGSKLIAVNGRRVTSRLDATNRLMGCFIPCMLVLERSDEHDLFKREEKDDGGATPTWLALSDNMGDMVKLNIHWFDEKVGKEDFILLIKEDATVAEIRAKIAVTSQLKFNAVKLISKGTLLKDDGFKLSQLNFKDNEEITVVVSQTTQEKPEEKVEIDYLVQMKIIGAFLKSCDQSIIGYLWDDIDYDEKGMLHITELDRLLARFMGLYERANCVHIPMEYKHGTVAFNTKDNLGLVIEGNEVIMAHPNTQAERQGMVSGWKVIGAEYYDKEGHMVKYPVDQRSCLESLKRAKVQCADDGFRVLCLIPIGQRYETMMIMKKQAFVDLKLDNPQMSNTLQRRCYDQLPLVFAKKAVRLSFKGALEASAFTMNKDSAGAFISKDAKNEDLQSYTGGHVLDINSVTVAKLPFGDVIKVLLASTPPHVLTLDMEVMESS